MTDDEKKRLDTFEARLRQLIFLYEEEKRKTAGLEQLLTEKEYEKEKVCAERDALEQKYANLKNAMAISLNGGDVKETKQRLSNLVREVDKCIALLNKQ
jgi:hypothetical protein